ncbi:MAG: hypothetical protein JRI23_12130 [Deltaproteobacteria bacterium]|nr:hypothetical protein [Deltaproteobacteria bacterium]
MPPPAPLPPPGPEPRDTGRENFFRWYTRKPIAWVLTGVAGLGLVGTISFGAAAAHYDSSADEVSDAILAEVRRWEDDPTRSGYLPDNYYSSDGTPQPCGDFDDPASAYPHYSTACDTLRDNINARDTDLALMTVSIVLMAASVGGTVIYYFVDTSDGEDPGSVEGAGSITAGPIITPTMQGVGIIGTF